MVNAPFVRQFGPNAIGPDVLAVKLGLINAGFGKGISKTETFGVQAQAGLTAFKQKHGLLNDPIYTLQAHTALEPSFLQQSLTLFQEELEDLLRHTIIAVADWTVAHNYLFDYTQNLGNGPSDRLSMEHLKPYETSQRIRSDCSGHYIGCACWAGLADPSGNNFDGAGATGALLGCTHIDPSQAKPGDGVIFTGSRWPAGHHIVMLHHKLPNGDWMTVSHGHQGDPHYVLLSDEARWQAGYGAPTLVWIALPIRRQV